MMATEVAATVSAAATVSFPDERRTGMGLRAGGASGRTGRKVRDARTVRVAGIFLGLGMGIHLQGAGGAAVKSAPRHGRGAGTPGRVAAVPAVAGTSQTRKTRSSPAVTTDLPSGVNAAAQIGPGRPSAPA